MARKRLAATATAKASNPGPEDYEEGVMHWIGLAIQEGLAQNRSEFHYDKIGQAIDAIMGTDEPVLRSPRLSNARLTKIQKIALEMRSMLTDIKLFWTYTCNNPRYQRQADIFGKLAKSWYLRRGIDQVFRDAIDYVLAAGTGYIHLFYNPDTPGPLTREGVPFSGDIDCVAEDPRDVGMIRFSGGNKHSVQNCRGVFVRRERPTSQLLNMYPDKEDAVKTDRIGFEKESPTQRRMREMQDAVIDEGGAFQGVLFGGAPAQRIGGPVPVTDEFTVYLHDYSVNETSKPKEMGPWIDAVDKDGRKTREPGAPWAYVAEPGKRFYPFGRRIVCTRHGILEDGPGHFHHGKLPICKVTLDTWAWSRWGTSPIHPLLSLQRAVDENVRAIQDHIRRSAKRNFVYDKKAISPELARKFDTRKSGMQLGINPHAAGPKGAFQIVDEPPLDAAVPAWLQQLLDMMDELAGVANLRQMLNLNQMPSGDTIQQMINAMTPLVRARSRAMEVFVREFAMMLASMFMQFYTLELRLRILGPEGMTYEDWSYKPGDLMPDFVADEDYEAVDDGMGGVSWRVSDDAWHRGPAPEHIRNQEMTRYFDYDIAPGTLLDTAKATKQLLYLQFSRMGIVDHWTLGEIFEIPNQGEPPSWATNITLRLQAEKMMGLGVIASTVGRSPTAQAMPSLTPTGAISESG